ncbi:MAG: hypothetical protein M3495_14575 [Pseudomonadota bacterium]|nr:hypothetical protein [Gammaproteobacteria bacterium]MDQ3582747.1 hypothetical protein [Pseudomonadota bacterium]
MERIEIDLDTQTIERARRLAEVRHCTVEQLLKEMIENLGSTAIEQDVFLGMFAEEPEVIDRMLEMAMQAREQHPLRQSGG